jgi:DNA-binding transcriptional ArsR family regulator
MKPLSHPNAKDVTVEGILYAFSDPVRVKIYAEIASSDCSRICSNFLEFDNKILPKSTLSHHFRILRESGLIRSERRGVEMHNVTRCDELKERFGPMIEQIVGAYMAQAKRNKSKK